MTTDLVKREQPGQALVRMSSDQLRYIAATDFVPKAMRGNVPAVMACVATGRELGLGDMESLRSIHIIDGKATMAAELMVKLVRKRGHSITAKAGDGTVTVTGRRVDNGDEMEVLWTRDMAVRADLLKKDNWKKYPEAMLWARAVSQLCRMLFPDCLGGVSLTPDEAELSPEERVNEAIGEARAPEGHGPDDSLGHPELGAGEGSRPSSPVAPDGPEDDPVAGDTVEEQESLFTPPASVETDPVVQAAVEAAAYEIPNGKYRGLTLNDLQEKGEEGVSYMRWALANVQSPEPWREALWAFARVYYPELHDTAAERSVTE